MSEPNQIGAIQMNLDSVHQYRRELLPGEFSREAYVRAILDRVRYPRRLLVGLDDISLPALEQYLKGTQLFILGLRLTNVCNYDCVYCGTAERRGRNSGRVLKTDEYIDLIVQASELGVHTILFGANGEPLMTRDLLKIIECVSERKMVPLIFTNASLLGNDLLCERLHGVSGLEMLQHLDAAGASLMISCESLQRERYNKIMRVNGYDPFMNAIARIRTESSLTEPRTFEGRPLCRIGFSILMMPENYDERHALVDFVHELNGLAILKLPSLHGAAKVNINQMFSVEQGLKIKGELESLSDKQATLQILTLACASWTLGMSIDNEGNFMACMTEEINPFESGQNARSTRLAALLGRRVELVKLRGTVCPVKDKFYRPRETVQEAGP
jgi:MoaA/NifB/PqqE/SkfB family radical SAM enzyme